MRALAASVLVFEGLVVFFGLLVAKDLADEPTELVVGVGGAVALACVVVAGLLRHRWAYAVGWTLQVVVVATGVVLPAMFFMGAVFAALWYAALRLGQRVDDAKRAAG